MEKPVFIFGFNDKTNICVKTIRCENTIKHTYIISKYNPSVRIIDLVSHPTFVACVNFLHKWLHLQFKVDSERQIFEKIFMAILFTLGIFPRNILRWNRRRNVFCNLFWYPAWDFFKYPPWNQHPYSQDKMIYISTVPTRTYIHKFFKSSWYLQDLIFFIRKTVKNVEN